MRIPRALIAGMLACTSLVHTATTTAAGHSQAEGRSGALTLEPYHFEAELGRLRVPERHARPNGRSIELVFVRFRSTSTRPGPPIVYLAGGPGGSAISIARGPRFPVFMRLREAGDVIALDQRGTGLSTPNLACTESLDYPLDEPGRREALLARFAKQSRACAASWRSRGIDLRAYTTPENAEDVETLRQALGAETVSLRGSSYGTTLALAVLRRHASSVHRIVLSGVEGPDDAWKRPMQIERQIDVLARAVRADPALRAAVPDLRALMKSVWRRLDRRPLKVSVSVPGMPEPVAVALGGFDLRRLTAALLGDREGMTAIPALYHDLSVADLESPYVAFFARMTVEERRGPIGSAMAFATDCSAGASPARRALVERDARRTALGRLIDFPFPEVCASWGVADVGGEWRSPVRSTVPALFLSGTRDGRTPPENAEHVRRGFPNSVHVIIDGAGHGHELFVSSPLIAEVEVAFLAGRPLRTRRILLPPMKLLVPHARAMPPPLERS